VGAVLRGSPASPVCLTEGRIKRPRMLICKVAFIVTSAFVFILGGGGLCLSFFACPIFPVCLLGFVCLGLAWLACATSLFVLRLSLVSMTHLIPDGITPLC
jgi:hypothetical protein